MPNQAARLKGNIKFRAALVIFANGLYVTVQDLSNAVDWIKGSLDYVLSSLSSQMFLFLFFCFSLQTICVSGWWYFSVENVEYLEHRDTDSSGSLPTLLMCNVACVYTT